MNNPKELETALDALRDYFQTAHRDLEGLRDDSGVHEQRASDMAAMLEIVQQELRAAQQATTLLETTLRDQTAAAREQGEAQTHELAALDSRQQAHGQELADHAEALARTQEQLRLLETTLRDQIAAAREQGEAQTHELAALDSRQQAHGQELADHAEALARTQEQLRLLETTLRDQTAAAREQRETRTHELAALDSRQQAHGQELADHAEALARTQEQLRAEVAKTLESLHVSQEKMIDFDHRLAARAEQFGKFDSVIRELHGELLAIHQRLTVLEATASPDLLAAHAQRLDQAEQQVLEQRQTLNELRQVLERLESRESAPAKTNTALLGIGLAVLLTAVLVLISLNAHIF